ncbi:sulfite oxidase heme-binding subunit YedZ [Inquilinus limosus]|uniref:sulfite oxidase heme-binding subunit YedZ n=1 Tax=Inquilinus limosus TaxID=171674 RepID=UPI0004273E86|nr:protein-methionine-sulfoxide reductase heme-binding subunit MsrQ [Inquilinus limosus]
MRSPFTDRAGRFSWLKTVVFVLLLLPGLWYGGRLLAGDLGADPVQTFLRNIGLWVLYLLVIGLAVTPLKRALRWPQLIQVRRMIGVAAATYVLIHFTGYIVLQRFDLTFVASEIVKRLYLTIGFLALLGLMPLLATSTDAMVKRLGGKAWQRLHRLVYAIVVLGLIHGVMQSKVDVAIPTTLAGFTIWLLAWRVLDARFGRGDGLPLWSLALLSVVTALVTAGGEAAMYGLFTGVDPMRVLRADLVFTFGPRPAWIVLGAGLAVTLLAALRRLQKDRARRPALA